MRHIGLMTSVAICALVPAVPAMAQDNPTATPPDAKAAALTGEQPTATDAAAAQAEEGAAGEIIVTGSRIARSGFDAPTPTKVLTAEAIDARGLSNVGDFLNEIPAFRPSQSAQTNAQATLGAGQSYADLRGLGNIRTLTLIDGRRHVPSSATGQVDLNLVPTILVDRVDVVTGGASAAYGSDAVSGVVNIILAKRLQGFRGDVSYGLTQYGDNREKHAALGFGTAFDEDRGHIVIGGEYVSASGIDSLKERDWGRRQDGLVSYVGARPAGAPSRFYARGTQLVNLAYGGLIIGANADTNAANGRDVLRGIEFGPGGVPQPFNYGNAIGVSATNFAGGDAGLFPQDGHAAVAPVSRRVALAHVDYEVTDGLTLFAEANYGRSGSNSKSPPVRDTVATAIVIRRDNAFLPASIAAIMDANAIPSFSLARADNDFGEVRTSNQSTTERGVAGFNADLGGSWKLDGYAEYGRNAFSARAANLRIEQNFAFAVDAVRVNGNIVCRNAAAAPAGCVPINLFGVGSPSAAAIDYVTGTQMYDVVTKQKVAALNLQGEPFSTWAGPVSIAVGGEYRKETAVATSDEIAQRSGYNYSNPKPFRGNYTVKEAYVETIVPLARDSAIGRSLELNAAARYTDYSTSGGVTTWKVGLTYEPIPDIRFRGTRSRDIRAPNNSEIFATTNSLSTLRNPFSGATTQYNVVNISSPNLRPEKADTKTAGVVLSPRFIPGLTFSVDYYDIKIKGAIAGYGAQIILDNCSAEINGGRPGFFCGFVDRTGTGAATIINNVNVQLLNIASLTTRGIDFEAAYRFDLGPGKLAARLFGTYTKDLISNDGLGTPRTYNAAGIIQNVGSIVNRAGQVGGFTSGQNSGATNAPHWVANGSISYVLERFQATVQGRYVGGGSIDNTLVGPDSSDYNPLSPISIGYNRIPSRFYANLSAQVDLLSEGRRKLQLYGVVNNLTNVDPPFPVIAISGLYDRLGRSFKLGARFAY